MHPLDGLRLKIARAKTEIDQLGLMQDAFFENTDYSIFRAEQNPISGKYIYRIKIVGPPPSLDWGIHIGEVAHNLRSALNHLVYQLALINRSNKPETVAADKRLQFPIFLVQSEFNAKGKNMIKLLRSEHKAIIERLQPYDSNSMSLLKTVDLTEWRGSRNPLFWLEEINNADKHRIIQVAGVKPGAFMVTYWGDRPEPFIGGTFGILEDGAIFGEADPEVHVNTKLHPLIAFANGCDATANWAVVLMFNLIFKTVSEIIEYFASEF